MARQWPTNYIPKKDIPKCDMGVAWWCCNSGRYLTWRKLVGLVKWAQKKEK
jgi:hypothetical protein